MTYVCKTCDANVDSDVTEVSVNVKGSDVEIEFTCPVCDALNLFCE